MRAHTYARVTDKLFDEFWWVGWWFLLLGTDPSAESETSAFGSVPV